MKRLAYCILPPALLVCTILSCSRRHTEPITGRTVDVSDKHVGNGQILYNAHCDRCHPAGGGGLGPEVLGKPGFARRFQVRHGAGVMPAFSKDEIGKPELDDIMSYLRALKRL